MDMRSTCAAERKTSDTMPIREFDAGSPGTKMFISLHFAIQRSSLAAC